jgi:hypothetical protein
MLLIPYIPNFHIQNPNRQSSHEQIRRSTQKVLGDISGREDVF